MDYKELVKKNAGDLIEQLIALLVKEGQIDIRFDEDDDDDKWAIVTVHLYEEDKEISVRLHHNDQYDLYFGYYDDEDEFFEIIHGMSAEETDILPESLRKLMKHVLDKEAGMRVPASLITK
jgi:hypothetical protein